MNLLVASVLGSALLFSQAEPVDPPEPVAVLDEDGQPPAPLEVVDQTPVGDASDGGLPTGGATDGELSSDPGELFVHANEAYESEDYVRAIRLYKTLAERGFRDGTIEYNLGNAYLRNGELGRAIAAYRRAGVSLPRDQDLAANLAFARESRKDALEAPGAPAIMRTLFFWHWALSKRELILATILANCIFWGLLALRRRRPGSEALSWGTLLALLTLLALGGSLAFRAAAPERVAVVIPQVAEVRSELSDESVLRFELHAGAEVRLLEKRRGWARIALPDGAQGWLEERHVEIVELR